MSLLTVKDKKKIREIFQKEFDRILGVNDPKMRNINYLIETIRKMEIYQNDLGEKLNGMIQQIAQEQGKIQLLEKFIDESELAEKYQEFLKILNEELDHAEETIQP